MACKPCAGTVLAPGSGGRIRTGGSTPLNTPCIEFATVTHGYAAGPPVLRELSLTVSGEVCAVLGANGAGKSTLLKLAAALLAPQRGTVTVAGRDTRTDLQAAKQTTAYLPETVVVDDLLTVAEVLTFVADLRGVADAPSRMDDLCRQLHLTEHLHTLFGQLSFGSRRKVGLVAAFMASPPILVLDEPDTGLDVPSVNALERLLAGHRAADGCTLLSSHDMAFVARCCTRLLVLNDGQMAWHGTPQALLAETGTGQLYDAVSQLLANLAPATLETP